MLSPAVDSAGRRELERASLVLDLMAPRAAEEELLDPDVARRFAEARTAGDNLRS